MSTLLVSSPGIPTLADLLARLGGISPERVRFYPVPGTGTEADVVAIEARENRLCELVDGVLVEKTMGYRESYLAGVILRALGNFVVARNLGLVTGEAGMMQLLPEQVRIPDVAFVSWARLPGGKVPKEPVPELVPDLAVEVLSAGNTAAEMERKCREYFQAGVQLVWLVDADRRNVRVLTGPEQVTTVAGEGTLDGGAVLPGFRLSLAELFAGLEE